MNRSGRKRSTRNSATDQERRRGATPTHGERGAPRRRRGCGGRRWRPRALRGRYLFGVALVGAAEQSAQSPKTSTTCSALGEPVRRGDRARPLLDRVRLDLDGAPADAADQVVVVRARACRPGRGSRPPAAASRRRPRPPGRRARGRRWRGRSVEPVVAQVRVQRLRADEPLGVAEGLAHGFALPGVASWLLTAFMLPTACFGAARDRPCPPSTCAPAPTRGRVHGAPSGAPTTRQTS